MLDNGRPLIEQEAPSRIREALLQSVQELGAVGLAVDEHVSGQFFQDVERDLLICAC